MKGGHHWYYVWMDFCRLWRKLGVAMRDPVLFRSRVELRQDHLARANEATSGWERGTREGLLVYIDWELWEAQDALDPSAANLGEPEDTFHAGCCIMRAGAAVRRLRGLL